MKKNIRKLSIELIQGLYKHPFSIYFDDTDFAKSLRTTRKILPLSAILGNLKSNQYTTHDDWISDVEYLITQYEKSSSSPEYFSYKIMANEFHRIFKKQVGLIFPSVDLWAKNLANLHGKIGSLLQSHEEKEGNIQNLDAKLKNISVSVMKKSDMKSIIEATSNLAQDEMDVLIDIVHAKQPELITNSKVMTINLTKLYPDTAQAVEEYLKDVYQSKNIPYPDYSES